MRNVSQVSGQIALFSYPLLTAQNSAHFGLHIILKAHVSTLSQNFPFLSWPLTPTAYPP